MKNRDAVIWYQPRVRLWSDRGGEWHLAGEPDGLQQVLRAFRRVARGVEDRAKVELRTEPIQRGRNPVADRGVKEMYQWLHLVRDGDSDEVRIQPRRREVELHFGYDAVPKFGYALVEAVDGEGDFSITVLSGRAETRLWFWGYSNPHAVNTF